MQRIPGQGALRLSLFDEQPKFLVNFSFFSRFWGRGCDEALFGEKKGFSMKGGMLSVNGRFGKDFYRKGISVKRFGPFNETPDSED